MNPRYQLPGFNSYQIITNLVVARLPFVNHLEANYRYRNLAGRGVNISVQIFRSQRHFMKT